MRISHGAFRRVSFFALMLISFQSAVSAASLEVSIRVYQAGNWRIPSGKKIVVTRRPLPFQVVIRNRSTSSVPIYTKASDGYEGNIYLEVKNAEGKSRRINRRPQPSSSSAEVSQYMNPGEEVAVDILLDPAEWTVPETPPAKGPYKVRAAYYNGSETIRSEEYEVTFNIP